MKIKKLSAENKAFIKAHQLTKEYKQAKRLFLKQSNSFVLDIKQLSPKELRFYCFRLNKIYQAIFRIYDNEIEILAITKNL